MTDDEPIEDISRTPERAERCAGTLPTQRRRRARDKQMRPGISSKPALQLRLPRRLKSLKGQLELFEEKGEAATLR